VNVSTVFTVVLPWLPSKNHHRNRHIRTVFDHLYEAGIEAKLAYSVGGSSSPGAARNKGADRVETPVVVFNDADTIVPASQIREAARLAAEEPGLVYGYDLYLRCTEQATYASDPTGGPFERELTNPPSMGCAAISVECFQKVGCFDERFDGWGYEDVEFARRCAGLWPVRRVAGPAFHLWHGWRRPDDSPVDTDPDKVAANFERFIGTAA